MSEEALQSENVLRTHPPTWNDAGEYDAPQSFEHQTVEAELVKAFIKVDQARGLGRFDTIVVGESENHAASAPLSPVKGLIVQHSDLDHAPVDIYLRRGEIFASLDDRIQNAENISFLGTELIDFEPLACSGSRQVFGRRLDTNPYSVDALAIKTTPPEAVWTPAATVQHVLYVIPAITKSTDLSGLNYVHLDQSNLIGKAARVRLKQSSAGTTLFRWANQWKLRTDQSHGGQAGIDGATHPKPDNIDAFHMILENWSGEYRATLGLENLQQTTEDGTRPTPFPIWTGETSQRAREKATSGGEPDFQVGFTAKLLTVYRPSPQQVSETILRESDVQEEEPRQIRPHQEDALSAFRASQEFIFDLGIVKKEEYRWT